jgi:NhaA family Na+:H+ antiporter
LRPYVLFLVMPLFGFMNIGVSFTAAGLKVLADPVMHGIFWGLLIGKQLGVGTVIWLCVRNGLVPMPEGATVRQTYGIALLTGIGFTMSLFIGDLAFQAGAHSDAVRVGVLTGSLASATLGYFLLRSSTKS